MRAVNLLPAGATARGPRRQATQLPLPGPLSNPLVLAPVVAAVLVVTVLAFGYVTQGGVVSEKQETLTALQQQLAERNRPEPAPADTAASAAAPRLAAVGAVESTRVAWDEVLQQFSLVIPPDVSITALTAGAAAAAEGTAAPVGGSASFTVQGYTASQPSVARLLTRLSQVPTLSNVQLQSSVRGEMGGRPVINFAMSADIVPGGGS